MSRQQKLSPRQFDLLQREMLRSESAGCTPEQCVVNACNAARIKPPEPFQPVDLVVDPSWAPHDWIRGLMPPEYYDPGPLRAVEEERAKHLPALLS